MPDKVLGVGGSPRRGGNSDRLLASVLEGARAAGLETEALHLRDYAYQSCVGCEKCRKAGACTGLLDGMQLIYPKIIESRGLVLACPTHHYNVTAIMKAFIDRLYCFYEFAGERPGPWSSRLAGQGRRVFITAVCEQESAGDMGFTIDGMRMPMAALGYEIAGTLPVFGVFRLGGVSERENLLEEAREAGRRFASGLLENPCGIAP